MKNAAFCHLPFLSYAPDREQKEKKWIAFWSIPANEIRNEISEPLIISESVPNRFNIGIHQYFGLDSALSPRYYLHLAKHLSLSPLLLFIIVIIIIYKLVLFLPTTFTMIVMIMLWRMSSRVPFGSINWTKDRAFSRIRLREPLMKSTVSVECELQCGEAWSFQGDHGVRKRRRWIDAERIGLLVRVQWSDVVLKTVVQFMSGESGEMVLSVWTERVHSNDVVFGPLRVYGQNLFIETTPFSRPLFSSCSVWIKTWEWNARADEGAYRD